MASIVDLPAVKPDCWGRRAGVSSGWSSGPPNLRKCSPMANGYTHAGCYYTTRQIWTKDV